MNRQPPLFGSEEDRRALQLALLIDHVVEYAIFLLDEEGRIASWNPGAERINGYRAEEIVGRHFGIFYTPEDLERDHPEHELEIARREGRYLEEGWRVRKDGSRFWASVVITAIQDANGQRMGFGKVTRDLTERRAAQQELERSNAELARFASVAAHDLREPLRSIAGFSGLLRQRHAEQLEGKAHTYLEHIERASAGMQTLIDDLLVYARAGEGPRPAESVDVREAVGRVLLELGAAITDGAARIDVDVPPETRVHAPRSDVEAILRNLLGNAIKFSDGAPTVRVHRQEVGTDWRIWVDDDGIGIPDAELPRIFEPFRRLHASSERPGSGLGLAICQRVALRNGGGIGVESAPGAGSRFWFSLPRA